jgi:hypothetical protein
VFILHYWPGNPVPELHGPQAWQKAVRLEALCLQTHHLAMLCDRNKFFEPTEVATPLSMYGGTPHGPKHVKASEKFRNCVLELPGRW